MQAFPPPQSESLSPNGQVKKRDNSLDVFKFFLIFGVVVDHAMMLMGHDRLTESIYVFFYTYNIPMFVLVAGYFAKVGDRSEKYVKGTFEVLALFLVYNVVMGICYMRPLSVVSILTPQTGAWFLLALFVWRFSMMFVKESWINGKGLLVTLALAMLVGFCPLGDMLSCQRIFDMFPFYFIGLMMKKTNAFATIRRCPRLVAAAILILAAYLIYRYHPYQNWIYSGMLGLNPLRYVERLSFMGAALVLGACVYCLIPHNSPFFAKLGKKTLFIYIYHLIVIRVIAIAVNKMALPTDIAWLIGYILLTVLVCCLISNIKILNDSIHPAYLSKVALYVQRRISRNH